MMKLARAVFKTNNVDHCARLCHSSTVLGLAATFGSGAMTNSISCMEQADCILVIGSNTTEQHPLIGTRIVQNKTKTGSQADRGGQSQDSPGPPRRSARPP